ncbi:hypothetical protein CUMW_197370 [Citrus unshiu]|nr:hypothetical protein CUMW_197370 [Citrus unshiu]
MNSKCHFTGRNFISKSLSTFLSLLCIVQTQAMAVTIHNALPSLNALKSKSIIRNRPESRRVSANSVRCCQVATSDKQSITVSNGNDSLEICRVLNGMWQTSGGWGRIDRDDAVDAMLRYADAGLTTFDMADHYTCLLLHPSFSNFTFNSVKLKSIRGSRTQKTNSKSFCCVLTEDNRTSVVKNGNDMLDICRVVNGMWQTSGGWGKIDINNAVNFMLHYADAGLTTFDMADICKIKTVALTNFDTERLRIILENGIPVVSNQFLDTNLSIPFAGPPLNTPSLQKYKRMVDAWGGWSQFQVLLQTLKRIASKHGVSIPVVAVRYILDQPAVAGSMIGVRLGLAEHIQDTNAIFMLSLDEDDVNSIQEVTKKGKDLLGVIGDCGDEYRR